MPTDNESISSSNFKKIRETVDSLADELHIDEEQMTLEVMISCMLHLKIVSRNKMSRNSFVGLVLEAEQSSENVMNHAIERHNSEHNNKSH